MSRIAAIVTSLVLLAVGVLLGCHQIAGERGEREAALSDRAAIEVYHAAVPATYDLQEAWVAGIGEASRLSDPVKVAEAIRERVIPPLERYRNAIGAMPILLEDLRPVHSGMVAAHAEFLDALKAFSSGLDARNYMARRRFLRDEVSTFHSKQREYREAIHALYRDHGIALQPSPPIHVASGGGAQEG